MAPQELLADFLEEHELAAQLKRHPRTIVRWTGEPDGLPFMKLGYQRLYHVPSVRDWLMARVAVRTPGAVVSITLSIGWPSRENQGSPPGVGSLASFRECSAGRPERLGR